MSIIAEFVLDQESFALGRAISGAPELTLELDRIIPAETPGVPYLWVSGGDFEAFERVVGRSRLIDSVTMVDRSGDNALYRIEWVPDTESLMQELGRSGVAVLEAHRDGDRWFFRLRFEDHDDLSRFHDYCTEREIDYKLERVYTDTRGRSDRMPFGLTPGQYDILVLAVKRGYYAVPREITLDVIGGEIGISPQAASERVRRATETVLRTALLGPTKQSAEAS